MEVGASLAGVWEKRKQGGRQPGCRPAVLRRPMCPNWSAGEEQQSSQVEGKGAQQIAWGTSGLGFYSE